MMGCQNLAVPAEVMQHIVHIESGANPFAIGVVGGQLVRQPRNLDEALATAQMLEEKGYNFSLGLGQVNRKNFSRYGLASYQDAFGPCTNLLAASKILADCYASANRDWGKAFSCYYSGNFMSGYRDGYVQKIYASIGQSLKARGASSPAAAIPTESASVAARAATPVNAATADTSAYRLAIRSTTLLDRVVATTAAEASATSTVVQASTAPATNMSATSATNANANIFVPQVRGPDDPTIATTSTQQPAATSITSGSGTDHADLRKGGADAAFVF